MTSQQVPDYKMVPSQTAGCQGCDFRYMREVKCSKIDCRPRNGIPVVAKIIKQRSQL